jgi:hypothetical protein
MRCAHLAFAVLLAATLAVAAPALAHTGARDVTVAVAPVAVAPVVHPETFTAAPALPSVPWTALTVLSGLALAAAARPRRALALTLVLVVALLAFETGVHSTHHLDRGDEATHCLVAGLSAQLAADLVDVAFEPSLALLPSAAPPALAAPDVDARPIAPDAGRAPPVFPV